MSQRDEAEWGSGGACGNSRAGSWSREGKRTWSSQWGLISIFIIKTTLMNMRISLVSGRSGVSSFCGRGRPKFPILSPGNGAPSRGGVGDTHIPSASTRFSCLPVPEQPLSLRKFWLFWKWGDDMKEGYLWATPHTLKTRRPLVICLTMAGFTRAEAA